MSEPPLSPLARPKGTAGKAANRHAGDGRANGNGAKPTRVLIVDDSLTVRTILKRMVECDPRLEVAGTASSAERALAALKPPKRQLATPFEHPDVILLDLEMPGMGGLDALPKMLEAAPGIQVLVVSALTEEGAEATVAALATGAADTMLKPHPGQFDDIYRDQLLAKIHALATPADTEQIDDNARTVAPAQIAGRTATGVQHRAAASPKLRLRRLPRLAACPEVVAVGASTGGIHALNLMLSALTPQFDVPILITQHLPPSFIPVFARQLAKMSGRTCHIAENGLVIRRSEIVVAPGRGHMNIHRTGQEITTRITDQPVPSGCLPSVDPMLESVSQTCEARGLAIILSGMGRDGAAGARTLHDVGGSIWIQDAQTSPVWGMPGAVNKAGLASFVAPPEVLGTTLLRQVTGNDATLAPGTSAMTASALRISRNPTSAAATAYVHTSRDASRDV